jgi:hypothetical protein
MKRTPAEFRSSLSLPQPPALLSDYEKALWWAGKGDWEKAHGIVQEMHDRSSSLIHAFLHRQEGDISNAQYWYAKADSIMPRISLEQEWENLVADFLSRE